MFHCCICHQHARNTLTGVLRHIKEVHPHFTSSVVCGLDGCLATPKSFQALRKHIYRYHKNLLNTTPLNPASSINAMNEGIDVEPIDFFENEDEPPADSHDDDLQGCTTTKVVGAQFIMKTRDGRKLSQATTNEIITDTMTAISSVSDALQLNLFKKIDELGVVMTDDQRAELACVFSNDEVVNPFLGLETEYKQEKFIKEQFNYVVRSL